MCQAPGLAPLPAPAASHTRPGPRSCGAARWTPEFGVGAGYGLDVGQGPVHMLRWGVHLRAPLWVQEAGEPARSGRDFRWRLVFGGRRGD